MTYFILFRKNFDRKSENKNMAEQFEKDMSHFNWEPKFQLKSSWLRLLGLLCVDQVYWLRIKVQLFRGQNISGRSKTTLTRFWSFLTPYLVPTPCWHWRVNSFVGKICILLTFQVPPTYLPHLVNVVCECTLRQRVWKVKKQ